MVRLKEQNCSESQKDTEQSDDKLNFQLTEDVRHVLSRVVEEGEAVISEVR